MALPSIDTPTFEIEIPHTKETKKFRPFLVKEEKLLVLANESGEQDDMIRATQQIVTNCSFGEIDGEKLPIFSLQKIFMDLRSQSIGSKIQLGLSCGGCGASHTHTIDLEEIKITTHKDHSSKIKLDDTMFVDMKYPTAFEVQKLLDSENSEQLYAVVSQCVHIVYQDDEIFNAYESSDEERKNWVENLTIEQFTNVRKFFETMPTLEYSVNFKCSKCDRPNYMDFNGYQNFFA